MPTNTLFQFPECVKQLYKIRRTCTLKQSIRQILKTNKVTCHSMFMSFILRILDLVIVSKINLQWSCLLALSYTPCKQFKLERPSTEKLKFKLLDGVFEMF